MKLYKIEFIEEVKSSVLIKAKNKKNAIEIVNSGNFDNDKVIERDHFEITKIDENI
tara:strand:- start:244 stop:411 length:168 start_codon:yes stop_codon:yes gene_type:complete